MNEERERKMWALIKWRFIIQNDGKEFDAKGRDWAWHYGVDFDCSYCRYQEKYHDEQCAGCPVITNGVACATKGHPWDAWSWNENLDDAQKVLNHIKSIPVPPRGSE
jgi:hypothetical protein